MAGGIAGTYAISWSQTETDGLRGSDPGALTVGTIFSWHGQATRLDGPASVLPLALDDETRAAHEHAARRVQRMLGEPVVASAPPQPETDRVDLTLGLTDGKAEWTAELIPRPAGRPPLMVFEDTPPPAGAQLWVTRLPGASNRVQAEAVEPRHDGVASGTMIATPVGPRAVEDLRVGDLIRTGPGKAAELRWHGEVRLTGARLHAMPALRPMSIAPRALGAGCPAAPLLVAPGQAVAVGGEDAKIFGADEVLISASDLAAPVRSVAEPPRHAIVLHLLVFDAPVILRASGLPVLSFVPDAAGLDGLPAALRPGLEHAVPGIAGRAVPLPLRKLSAAEAAILSQDVA